MKRAALLAGLIALHAAAPAYPCSFLVGRTALSSSPTFREEGKLGTAKVILLGTLDNPRDIGEAGQTDFHIKTVLRSDPALKGVTRVVLPQRLSVSDKQSHLQYVVFADVKGKELDPYRGVPLQGKEASVEYLKKALALKSADPVANLRFYFKYLEDADPEVARDAFLEFAKASDADIARAAPKLDAAKLRGWLKSEKTPAYRLADYALLLGSSGKDADATYLRGLLGSKEERYVNAADGALGGYMAIKPKEGWELARSILADGRKSLPLRLSVLRTLRYFHGSRPKESREQLVKCMKTVLEQGELADLAAEDLRKWQIWDLTADVLKQYARKGTDSPLMRRAIVRYALCAPAKDKEAQAFLKARRADEPDVVEEVEEGLAIEREASKK
jgi:hypothetical protein